MKCPFCGAEAAGPFCHVCGTKIDPSTTCTSCGMEFVGRFCPFCGSPANAEDSRQQNAYTEAEAHDHVEYKQEAQQTFQQKAYQQPPIIINNMQTVACDRRFKNKWISFFLCLFLGTIGAHKFYEGRIGMGILYLCTGGLFGFGVLFDLISIIMKPAYYLP